MPILIFGVSHKTAPIEVREQLVIDSERLPTALTELKAHVDINESLILSTCNRTELYCSTASSNHRHLVDWLVREGKSSADTLAPHIYEHRDEMAVRHLLRVACGLDSMVLGEPQILGQLKDAYRAAHGSGSTGKLLDKLLQFSFHVAKEIRTDTDIGATPISVAYVAVRLAVQVHGDLIDKKALLIGAGDTITLAATHLNELRVGQLQIANRSLEKARDLAARFNAKAIALTDLPHVLGQADIIISSTASRLPIITAESVRAAMESRRHRPIFMVDLAVPRDIEPAVDDIEDIYLYDIDNLKIVIDENLEARKQAAAQADELVNIYTQEYMEWIQSLDSVNTIRQLRATAAEHRNEVLQRALKRLQAGDNPVAVIEQATQVLTNRLTHGPTVALQEPDNTADDQLLRAVRRLYGLDRGHGSGSESDEG